MHLSRQLSRKVADVEVVNTDGLTAYALITSIMGVQHVSGKETQYVERHNLSMRQHLRRLHRKTNGFSKSLRHHKAAIAMYGYWVALRGQYSKGLIYDRG